MGPESMPVVASKGRTVLFLYSDHAHRYRYLDTHNREELRAMSLPGDQDENGTQLPATNYSTICFPTMEEPPLAKRTSTIGLSSLSLISTNTHSSLSSLGNAWIASQCPTTSSLRLPQGPVPKTNLAPINSFPSMSSLSITDMKDLLKSSHSTSHGIYLSSSLETQQRESDKNSSSNQINKTASQASHSECTRAILHFDLLCIRKYQKLPPWELIDILLHWRCLKVTARDYVITRH